MPAREVRMFADIQTDKAWVRELHRRCGGGEMFADVVKLAADRVHLSMMADALERSRDRLLALLGSEPAQDAELLNSEIDDAAEAAAVAIARAFQAVNREGGAA